MSTIRILLTVICFAFTGSTGLFSGHLLARNRSAWFVAGPVTDCRARLLRIAAGEVGIREKTGENDGRRIEEYLAAVKLKRGDPYCAAFLSWVYLKEGFAKPRSGWSPDLLPGARLTKTALPANIIGIYFPELKRIAHVGMIEKTDKDWCMTIEGNTNLTGSREGEGVYRKRRHLKTIYRMADWVTPERGKL